MLWLLLRLRQACNHPWLVHGTAARYGGPGATSPSKALGSPAGKVSQSQLTAAKRLAGPLCQQLVQTLQQEPNVCAQCGDIPEDAVVSACHHVFCQQCITMQVCSTLHCYASRLNRPKESLSMSSCFTAAHLAAIALVLAAVGSSRPGRSVLECVSLSTSVRTCVHKSYMVCRFYWYDV